MVGHGVRVLRECLIVSGAHPERTSSRGEQFMWTVARRIGLFAVALTAGSTGLLAGPAAASAATVPGIQVVESWSYRTSADKTVTVHCPAGKKVIDAGGLTSGGYGQVTMDDVFPDQDLNFVNVTGLETDPTGDAWWVVASAVCADPLPGLEWIKAKTASDSSSPKTLTVACSPGKTVLGNGYAITGGSGEVFVDEAVPNGGPGVAATQVALIGVEGDPYDDDWDLEGFLICAEPLPGQQVLSDSVGSAFASCGDQVATGGTAELHNGTGTVVLSEDHVNLNNEFAGAEDNDAETPGWWVTAYVFCVDA
jgi:hypothetical protein